MASLVLGVAGAAVGSFFGPIGASIGWSLGAAVGNALFAPKTQRPPHDLHLQGSSYGAFLKIIYGTVRISGNVIWETDLQEHSGGGKGKTPEQSTFTASFDVALTETPVVRLKRFWAAGRLNYDVDQADGPTIPFVLYDGNAAQLPDPTEEAKEGVGNVPAYRAISRVVFTDWDMTQFGNSIPQLSFELETKGADDNLRIVLANYATGYTFQGFAAIQQWDADGIYVSNTHSGTSYTTSVSFVHQYDPTDLSVLGSPANIPIFSYPQWWAGIAAAPFYMGIGRYVYANGTSTPLNYGLSLQEVTASATNPTIVTGAVTAVNNGLTFDAVDPTKFLYTAGVPVGLFVLSCAMTEDGTQLFVFTAPTILGPVDTWHRIVDGLVVDDGPVDAGAAALLNGITGPFGMSGRVHGVAGDPAIYKYASFENNGQWMWYLNGNSQVVHIFTFAGTTFKEWDGGTLVIPFPADGVNTGIEPCIRAIGTGSAGAAKGHCLVQLSRLGDVALTYLDEVVADLCDRAGMDASEYDVTQLAGIVVDGYVIESQITVRAALETLMPVYFFDAVESDGVLKFVVRGADPIVEFLEDDLAAYEDGQELPSILSCVHTQDAELPSQLVIAYINREADYQINTQPSQRMVGGSRDSQTVQVPVVLTDAHAKKIVDAWLFNAWWERDAYTWRTSRKYAKYEPTDVCTIENTNLVLRITKKTEGANGVITWEGVPSRGANFVQAGAGGSAFSPGQVIARTQATNLVLLDAPLVADIDDPNGVYVAMAGAVDNTWRGATPFRSADGGTSYSALGTFTTAATMGTTSGALDDFLGGNVFDERNSVTVTIGPGGGALSNATADAVLNGAKTYLIGDELVQAKNADLIAPSTYLLSGFLRGRRGTEWQMAGHVAGERFVDMSTVVRVPLAFSELGQAFLYKAVSLGSTLASATSSSFTSRGAALRPYSPVHVGGGHDASGNVTINWQRRTRIGGAWVDFADVPLSETTELYVLQVWNSTYTVCARVVTGLTSPTFAYTSAMQVTDFGANQQTIYITVGQLGAYGLGVQTKASIPGAGGSDSAPLTPQQPYNTSPPPSPPLPGCSGTVINDTISWAYHVIYSPGDFGPGQTWVIKFSVPASPGNQTGNIRAGEYLGPPTQRVMTLSLSPCGPPLIPAAVSPNVYPSVGFCTGANQHPQTQATLQPSTDYYISITTEQVSEMILIFSFAPTHFGT